MIASIVSFLARPQSPPPMTAQARRRISGVGAAGRVAILLGVLTLGTLVTLSPRAVQAAKGDFSIDFIAAAPSSYNHPTGGGAYDDRTIGVDKDVVESLEGGDFACGDLVTYFATVTVDNTQQAATDAPQTIEMDFSFLADTTGQSGVAIGDIVGVQVNYGTVQDLIEGGHTDNGIIDDGGSTATLISESLIGALFQSGSELLGTVRLTDLEAGEQVVVRIDVRLFCDPSSSPTGNLQAELQAARLIKINGDTSVPTQDQTIPGGAQTVPFKHVGDIAFPSITLAKTGDALSKVGDTVGYTITLTNTTSADTLNLDCTISDPLLGLNEGVTLSAGQAHTINKTFTIPVGAPDPFTNTASASCTAAGFLDALTASASHTVNLFQPAITLTKTGDVQSTIGGAVTYTITLANPSSPDSPALVCTITDPTLGWSKNVTLASGATDVSTVPFIIPAGAADPFVNTASVTCSPTGFPNVLTASASWTTDLVSSFAPAITLAKTGDALSKVGDMVNYTITLTNTSSANTPNLVCTISDPLLGLNEPVTLASGANHVINASRTVQAGDPDPLVNTATASCTISGFPDLPPVTASASHTVNLFQPAITLTKTGDVQSTIGGAVTYTITLANPSSPDSPALVCTITDPTLGWSKNVTLASGATDVSTVPFIIPAGAADPFVNTASVTCSPTGFPNVLTASASWTTDLSLTDPVPCDVNGDGHVDRRDIDLIFQARNQPASGPNDPRDYDGDGTITVNDGRKCVLQCDLPNCALVQ